MSYTLDDPCWATPKLLSILSSLTLTLENTVCMFFPVARKEKKSSFVLIRSLPDLLGDSSFASVGSKIYVLGGFPTLTNAYSIDCISHIVQPISSVPVPMSKTSAHVIDEKIYLVGECREVKVMVVFNTKTQTWEPEMTTKPILKLGRFCYDCVVMADKIYMRNSRNSFLYVPKRLNLESDEMLNLKERKCACVFDSVLYNYDSRENKLRSYDTKNKCWEVVKGLEDFLHDAASLGWSHTVSYGGKLAVFLIKREGSSYIREEFWCAEIAIKRLQDGEIWGKVVSYDVVFNGGHYYLNKALVVMV